MTIPEGWLVHPQNGNYIYNPTTNEVRAMPQAAPAVAAAPAIASEQPWGQQDIAAANADLEANKARSDFSRDGNFIWINFPRKAAEESIYARFLPPWARDERKAYIESFRHRIYARLVPDAPENRDVVTFDCFDLPGGPGKCDICAAMERVANSNVRGAEEFYGQAKRKAAATWQMLDIGEPNKHYQELKDSQGQSYTGIVPALMRMGPQLHSAVLSCFRNGDFTHHEQGFPIELIRKQTGQGKFDVSYSVNHMAHHKGPIDPALINVLYNLINLRKEAIIWVKREKMQMIAQNIIQYYGGVNQAQAQVPAQLDSGQWTAHPQAPGYEYNTVTRQVRPIAATPPAAPPAAVLPPAAAPPVPAAQAFAQPAAAPGIPPAGVPAVYPPAVASGGMQVPPVAPPALPGAAMGGNQPFPPPAAPGLAGGGVPPALPPAAAPGIPPAVGEMPPAAPVPMSAEELQQNFAPPVPGAATGQQPPPPVMPPAGQAGPPDPTDPGAPPF